MDNNKTITYSAPVYTADEILLGHAMRLYHQTNPHNINPDLQLYATYLQVVNEALGDTFFIPTHFVATAAPARVTLAITMKQVQQATFSRKPTFIAMGHGAKEALAG